MAKIVINDSKTGKSYSMELELGALLGKKLGQKVDGSLLKLSGYELEITGGSDKTGNPMRKEVEGPVSRRLLLSRGVGFRSKQKGARKKKRIRGRTISADIVQVNMKIVKQGTQSLDKLIQTTPKEAPEEKKEEAKAEEKPKEEPKAEEKEKEEKPSEKPAEGEAPKEEKAEEKKEEKPPESKPEKVEEKQEEKPKEESKEEEKKDEKPSEK